ncbi:copper resistance CopC family protein [Cellulomonas edaphi]|uniref:Copper resistance protein CopC n=1 Tax=Cellulomonas edaphi TaxID=3053468 RepID=A0ABT7S300_9CELL|nr:copper resistance CopC family protein [Cellulomons edaphi]MDM7829998.1 copper resistance protein CopC [Cellulomons edaphi]
MRRRTAPASGLVVGVLLALGVAVAPAAQAHDELVGTEPADGTTVATVPEKVTLSFEEPAVALGTAIEVTSPDGTVVSAGDPVLVDTTVSQAVEGDSLPAGTYDVTWRVTSQDGHAVSGAFSFVAAQPTTAEASPAPTTQATRASTDAPVVVHHAAPSPSATADPTADPSTASDDDGPAPLAVIGVGLLIGAVFGLLGWRRARRRSAGGPERP